MKRIVSLVLITAALTSAQSSESVKKNCVDIQPVSLLNGISGSYTRLVGKSVGVQIEGGVSLWDPLPTNAEGARGALYVPIYLRTQKKHRGLSSPSLSPFISYQKIETDVEGTNSVNGSSTTRISVESVKTGVSYGRRWVYDNGFTLGMRAGYGFFPFYESTRGDNPQVLKDDEWNSFEKLNKFLSGFDAAFQIGFTF